MRIVLCDEDAFMREVVEALVAGAGHEVVGIADTTVAAVGLIEATEPDAVIVDLSVGYNTDFDMIAAANGVAARAIVFSYQADADVLDRYSPRPTFVPKPDLIALELELTRTVPAVGAPGAVERRVRPSRVATGPAPTGVTDAQAFFEAINDAQPGDAMVSFEVDTGAERIVTALRGSDRLLASPAAVRVFMPGGGEAGAASLLARLAEADALPAGTATAAIVVEPGELGADAFNRLRAAPAAAVP
jgi:hypothetical protein